METKRGEGREFKEKWLNKILKEKYRNLHIDVGYSKNDRN